MLGSLDVLDAGRRVPLGGSKQRALLAVLLLHANEVVSVDRLVDELWGDRPPGSAGKLVQGYVSALRRLLSAGGVRDGPLETQAPGYALRVGSDELDRFVFERLAAEARAADGQELAARGLRAALALWRGPALADVTLEGPGRQEAERLNERRLAVLVERIELDLELGRHADVIGELEELVVSYPFHERLPALLILALYRSGRQAEALRAYRDTRRRLVEELGLEPGTELQQLERQILAHDPALDLPRAPTPPPPAPPAPASRPAAPDGDGDGRRVRKMVTVLFSDVVEWSSLAERLDPEPLHEVQARYHEEIGAVLVRHGGTVEKFIGDAAVAVFGVPAVHEDDALRAVRAAAEIRDAVAELNHELERDWGVRLTVHTGVNTGEVVTGLVSAGHSLAAGDTMVVAARLQQAADAGEILLGADTYRLVADAVRAEPVEPLNLKGRSTPVPAWRLVELAADRPVLSVPAAAPLVGRRRELDALEEAYARVVAERSCRLCTVVGPPGIGKSRLLREFAAARGDATVVVGRCLPYGDGITYWPLVDIVDQLVGDDPQARIAELMEDDERAAAIAERVAGAVGRAHAAGSPEEIAWAVRKLFERVAADGPLVVVVDDAHWAEPTLLDLLEYLLGFASDAILLLCLARPDLLEQRPAWAAPRPATSLIALEPLSDAESRELLELIPGSEAFADEAVDRVVAAAEGNPLFLEQLRALHAHGGAQGVVPPSIHALLAARIDRLEPDEREVLERASIEGRSFHLGGLAALLPERLRGELETVLMALVRKEFVHADRSGLAGEEAFRFRHLLIRDAAYAGIPKTTRAQLHESFADWVAGRTAGRVELEDITGYHLEQAYRYREELGSVDEHARALARRGARLLASAADRASARGDVSAAATLLGRAASLLPADDPERLSLLPDLGLLLTEAGRLAEAEQVLGEARELAATAGDRRAELNAAIELAALHLLSDPRSEIDALLDVVEGCVPELEVLDDARGLSRAWYLVGLVRGLWAGRHAVAERALARALEQVRRTGDKRQEAQILNRLAFVAWSGPMPLPEAIARCHEILGSAGGDRTLEAGALRWLAALEARAGRFDEARRLMAESIERYDGSPLMAETMRAFGYADVELLAGDPAAAELELRRGYDALGEMGEQGYRSSVAGFLARALYAQGRYDEAERFTRLSEETAAEEDTWSQVLFRATRAKVLARRGADSEARELVTRMLALVDETDLLDLRGDALLDAAEVLRLLGDPEAAAYIERAQALYEQKGNVVSARRAAELAATVRAT